MDSAHQLIPPQLFNFLAFCKEGLADRWTSQSDLEKLESTDCEYDSEGSESLVRLRWKFFLEISCTYECDSVLDFTKELNEVGPTMKLFDITQQDRFTTILTMYQSFVEK